MNVLTLSHLYPSPAFPGTGVFVRDEVIELARRHKVAVVSPLRVAPVPFAAARRVLATPTWTTEGDIQILRPRLPAIPLGGLTVESRLWSWRLSPLLGRIYGEIDGDLLHAHFALPDGFAAAQYASRAGVPLVLTIWGSDVMVFGQNRSLAGLFRRTFEVARAVIAVSDQLAESAESLGACRRRLHVIPGGVPYPAPMSRDEARARLNVPDVAVCLLWVGGLVPVKQPLDAIKALEHAIEAGLRAMLVMVGDGPLDRDIRELVSRKKLAGAVRLMGYCGREDVWMWHCAADVLINSSRSEGTPIAVLEALGAGTRVVAYPVGGIGSAVEAVAGGRVAAEKTPRSLVAALAEELALNSDRGRLARDARDRFDIAATGRAIQEVYEAVI